MRGDLYGAEYAIAGPPITLLYGPDREAAAAGLKLDHFRPICRVTNISGPGGVDSYFRSTLPPPAPPLLDAASAGSDSAAGGTSQLQNQLFDAGRIASILRGLTPPAPGGGGSSSGAGGSGDPMQP